MGWLERIRDIIAGILPCSLDATHAVVASPAIEGEDHPDRQRRNMRTPWLVVGRYDPQGSGVGYSALAHALSVVGGDLFLEEAVGAQRLSQIRIVYVDPNTRRGEGDSIVSRIGAWQFVCHDIVYELVGGGTADEESLAVRYKETRIPHFYVYFSANIVDDPSNVWQRFGL